jgi:hypothetical protein
MWNPAQHNQTAPYPFDGLTHRDLIQASQRRVTERGGATPMAPQTFFSHCIELDQLQDKMGRDKLAAIAVQLVSNEFGLTGKELAFKARLIDPRRERLDPIKVAPAKGAPPQELLPELTKRQLCNALIQGAAHAVQYRFVYESKELTSLDPALGEQSKSLMAAADSIIFGTNPRKLNFNSLSPAGKMSLDFSTTPITVRAEALHFPVLVHELAKGVLEALALHGLPNDSTTRQTILNFTDRPELEPHHMVLGGELWRRVNAALPEWKTPAERNLLLQRMFSLPPAQFNQFVKEAAEGNIEAAQTRFRS